MNLMNFGRDQLGKGSLDEMLKQVGINDVGTFVNQFRGKVNQEAAAGGNASGGAASGGQQPDLMSMGSSLLNQFGSGNSKKQSSGSGDLISGAMNAYQMFSGSKGGGGGGEGHAAASGGGGGSADMINNAMKAYKMFSGGKGAGESGASGGGGGGGIFDNIGGAVQNAQQIQGLLKKLDRNGDGKITIDDIQLLLQGLGLGSFSTQISKALFKAVDRNGNGELDLTDAMALAAIVSKLQSRFGAGQPAQ